MLRISLVLAPCLLAACVQSDATREASASVLSREAAADTGSQPLRAVLARVASGNLLDERRIFGGVEARQGDDPWQVALVPAELSQNIAFCGGSLIGREVILTAAHCVDGGTLPGQVDVVAGSIDLARGERIRVARIDVHPDWNPSTHDNDLALLRLARPTDAGRVDPVTPAIAQQFGQPRASVRVTGWGRTATSGSTVSRLQTVDVPIVSTPDCNDPVAYRGLVTGNMLCAGFEAGGRDSCQGDSGGPLTVAHGGRRSLIGIVSWGEGCARRNKYGVYTRVANYGPWIASCAAGRSCAR